MLHWDLDSRLNCSSVLKVFARLVCPRHAQVEGKPGTCICLYTELWNPFLQPLVLQDFSHTLWIPGLLWLERQGFCWSVTFCSVCSCMSLGLLLRQSNRRKKRRKKPRYSSTVFRPQCLLFLVSLARNTFFYFDCFSQSVRLPLQCRPITGATVGAGLWEREEERKKSQGSSALRDPFSWPSGWRGISPSVFVVCTSDPGPQWVNC